MITTENCIHVPPATLRRVKQLYNLHCLSNWRRGSETRDHFQESKNDTPAISHHVTYLMREP